ncbi:CHAP domain-containing protein [Promicromonospora sp. NPDC050249]|uniref:CHAP domain-containing protein n=1 Tax=Promicromonospora sp. NPDC050249 TaxID=3154743 RepID=UPI0033C7EF70
MNRLEIHRGKPGGVLAAPTAVPAKVGWRRLGRTALVAVLAMMSAFSLTAPPATAATTRERIVAIAAAEIGGTECNPGYFNSCDMEWCAEFARWVWAQAGVTDRSGLDGWAQSFTTYGQERGLYHSSGSGYTPQPGDAIVFDWDGDGGSRPIDHVAIVTSVTSTRVYTIGGNQSDTVSRRDYARTNGDIVGYTSPAGVDDEEEPRGRHSVTGDSYADLVARKPDGTLWLYANNFVRDDGAPYNAARQIGNGWNTINAIVNADVTGDGYTDLVGRRTDGTLWLYPNNIERDNGDPYGEARQIGNGWNTINAIVGADVTGDGYTDLVGRRTDGTLWLYANNIERDNGDPYGEARQIGNGWNTINQIVGADVTGDGYTDLVGRRTDGTLWLYPNNIERDNGDPYGEARQIGNGWNTINAIVGADVTGDGYTDLVGRRTDGTLWLYANNIERDNGDPYGEARQIGNGWGMFDHIS